jgi:hypothetical protein
VTRAYCRILFHDVPVLLISLLSDKISVGQTGTLLCLNLEPIIYSVTATISDPLLAREYTAWLAGGHIQDVVRAGALSGELLEFDDDGSGCVRVQARYVFVNPDAFEAYVRDHAPRLRGEGLAKFGSRTEISFARTVAKRLAGFNLSGD